MDNHMENIISQLSHIEETAVRIKDSIESRKKELEIEMEKKIAEFDKQLLLDTQKRMEHQLELLNKKKDSELLKAQTDTEQALSELDTKFTANHNTWAKEILNSLIGV